MWVYLAIAHTGLWVERTFFPSGSRDNRAAAAAQTPVSGSRGEAGSETGRTSEGEVCPSSTPHPPARHPELLLNWRPSPDLREELSDAYLAGALSVWSTEVDR